MHQAFGDHEPISSAVTGEQGHMSNEALETRSKIEPRYRFEKGEDLRHATGRIVSEQLSRAVQVLSQPEDSLEQAVHEARRCIKRARSVLRLVKFAIPKAYARENSRLRDVGRSLSELRDSHALVQTLDGLKEQEKEGQENESEHRAFEEAHSFLESRGEQIAKAMEKGGMEQSIAGLKNALAHIEKLSYAKVHRQRLTKSLYKSVKRGMAAFAAAEDDPKPEKFHEWRKRAKDLRYQLSLFSKLRPDLQEYSRSAKELEQLLGDDHNLAVLVDLLGQSQKSGAEKLHSLHTKISGRQSALRGKARKIGTKLYGEKRKVWKRRLAATSMDA
jgi:CHAD domain-containing protein